MKMHWPWTPRESRDHASLQALPREILRQIIPLISKGSSLNLMLTCHTLSEKIHPFLYECIEWNIKRTHFNPIALNLLRAILKRPELGHLILEFRMIGRYHREVPQKLSTAELDRLKSLAPEISGEVADAFFPESDGTVTFVNSSVMLVVLLLHLCPNIKYLTPWSGYIERTHFLDHLRVAISRLPNLRSLDYGTSSTHIPELPWNSESIDDLLALRTLRKLRLHLIESLTPRVEPEYPPISNITSFELHNSLLKEESIDIILSRMPHLTSLSLSLFKDTEPMNECTLMVGSLMDCHKLSTALVPRFALHLEHLAIATEFLDTSSRMGHMDAFREDGGLGGPYEDGRDGLPGQLCTWGTIGSIVGLNAMSQLKTLEIDPVLLLGWHFDRASPLDQLLPESLQWLKFRSDFYACRSLKARFPILKDLFADYVNAVGDKGLESLSMTLSEPEFLRYEVEIVELRRICKQGGIHLEIEKLRDVAAV